MSLQAMSDQDILDDIRSFEEAIRMYRAELERRFQERIAPANQRHRSE